MKKRVTIYLDEKDWMEIRLEAVKNGISAGDYLRDLHRSFGGEFSVLSGRHNPFHPENIIAHAEAHDKKLDQGINIEAKDHKKKTPVVPQEKNQTQGYMAAVEPELSVRDKYKLKFPNQLCPNCKNKNKDCRCD